jgi:hypothetical protein
MIMRQGIVMRPSGLTDGRPGDFETGRLGDLEMETKFPRRFLTNERRSILERNRSGLFQVGIGLGVHLITSVATGSGGTTGRSILERNRSVLFHRVAGRSILEFRFLNLDLGNTRAGGCPDF